MKCIVCGHTTGHAPSCPAAQPDAQGGVAPEGIAMPWDDAPTSRHTPQGPPPPPPVADSVDPLIGTTIGSFKISKIIGKGGMGTVYLGEQTVIGSRVAIKILHDHLASNASLVQRFYAEARAVNLIGHENIVNIFDMNVVPPRRYYLVMELLEGKPLNALLRGPMAPELAVPILTQVCDALDAAHSHGVVHRDLKPENIYLVRRGRQDNVVKILDFGIAKLFAIESTGDSTAAGTIVGTPEYMAPEQCTGEKVDGRTDLYALGVIAYAMLTGRLPFSGGGVAGLLVAHQTKFAQPPHQLVPSIPLELSAAVMRALAKRPDDRFQTAGEFANALEFAVPPNLQPRSPTWQSLPRIGDTPAPGSSATPQQLTPSRGASPTPAAFDGPTPMRGTPVAAAPMPTAPMQAVPAPSRPPSGAFLAPHLDGPRASMRLPTIDPMPQVPPPSAQVSAALSAIPSPPPIAPLSPGSVPVPPGPTHVDRTPTPHPVHQRMSARFDCLVSLADGSSLGKLICQDISRGGCFLVSDGPFPPMFAKVKLVFPAAPDLQAPAEVVRHVTRDQASAWGMSPGFGVQFAGLQTSQREAVDRLMKGLPAAPLQVPPSTTADLPAATRLIAEYNKRINGDHYVVLAVPEDAEVPAVRARGREALRELNAMLEMKISATQRAQLETARARVQIAMDVLGNALARSEFDALRGNFRGVARCLAAGLTITELEQVRRRYMLKHPGRDGQAQVKFLAGQAQEQSGNVARALATYEEALALDPLNLKVQQSYWALKRRGQT